MGTVDEFFSKFADEMAVIKATPRPFILAVALVIGAVWFIVNYTYSAVITSKNAQLELADRQIADYKLKLSESIIGTEGTGARTEIGPGGSITGPITIRSDDGHVILTMPA